MALACHFILTCTNYMCCVSDYLLPPPVPLGYSCQTLYQNSGEDLGFTPPVRLGIRTSATTQARPNGRSAENIPVLSLTPRTSPLGDQPFPPLHQMPEILFEPGSSIAPSSLELLIQVIFAVGLSFSMSSPPHPKLGFQILCQTVGSNRLNLPLHHPPVGGRLTHNCS